MNLITQTQLLWPQFGTQATAAQWLNDCALFALVLAPTGDDR